MNQSSKNLQNFFTKLGLLVNILPYLGDIDEWKWLYSQLSPESIQFWKSNTAIFKWLDKSIYGNPLLDGNDNLKIDLESNNSKGKSILSQVTTLPESNKSTFKRINRLNIMLGCGIGHKESVLLNKFLTGYMPPKLKVLYLRGAPNYTKLHCLKDGLAAILPKVQNKITLVNFSIDQETVKVLFDSCYNCKEISLYSCRVGDITDAFELDADKKYKLKAIDFHNTCEEFDSRKIDAQKLPILVRELARTHMKESLEDIKMSTLLFSKEKVLGILDQNDLEVALVAQN